MKQILIIVLMMSAITCSAKSHKGVKVTAYMPVVAQCNYKPLVTADGSRINIGKLKLGIIRWCAVSRDLLKHYPFGSKIYIEGHGWYEVHDTCNKRLKKVVDILVHPSHKGFCETNKTIHD